MQVTLEVPDTAVYIEFEIGFYEGDQPMTVTGRYVDPQENDYIDMMPVTKLQ